MKLLLTWEEFVARAILNVPNIGGPPHFLKDHGPYNGGIGDAYDLPDFVELPVNYTENG